MGVSGSIFRLLAETLVDEGVPDSLIEQHSQLPREYWEDDWVDDDVEDRLWELAVERLPDIGIRAAKRLPRGTFRGLEYAFRTAPDVERALQVVLRFQVLLHGRPILAMGDRGQFIYSSPHTQPDVEAATNELAIGILIASVHDIAGRDGGIEDVRFSHRRPDHVDALREFLGAEPKFEQTESSVRFTDALLSTRSREADPVLHALLQEMIRDELEEVPELSWAGRVREAIRTGLLEGDATLPSVAKSLGVSERALQDHLKDEGVSFRETLDATRHVLAMRYLTRSEMSISGIAFMLGYSEQSTFQRAFKRWSGETPARYRRAQLGR